MKWLWKKNKYPSDKARLHTYTHNVSNQIENVKKDITRERETEKEIAIMLFLPRIVTPI